MKVVLINPDQSSIVKGIYPSLGIGYLAASLEKERIQTKIWDVTASSLTKKEIEFNLKKENPDVVGISANSFTFLEAKNLAKTIKTINPKTKIIVGGPQVTLYPRETLLNSEFDFAIYGEAEISLPNLVNNLSGGNFEEVNGIAYRKGSEIKMNSPEELIKNLDSFDFPARHLMPMDKYFSPIARSEKYHVLLSSRGCPFSCTYCAPMEGKKFRMRGAKNFVDEIEELTLKYGIKELQFYDDSFSVKKERVSEICDEIINRNLNLQWDARTRVDIVDGDLLKKMKASGCTRIRYGVESGNQDILGVMNKNITLEQIRDTINLTQKIGGIETLAYFMVGAPGENLKTIKDTIELARELKTDHVRFNITTAYPGTKMYQEGLDNKIFKEDYWKQYARGELDYVPELLFETKEYKKKDLEKIIKYAYNECEI